MAVQPFGFTLYAAGNDVLHLPKILFMSAFSVNGKSTLYILLLVGTCVPDRLESCSSINYSEANLQPEMSSGKSHKTSLQCPDGQPLKIFFLIIIH